MPQGAGSKAMVCQWGSAALPESPPFVQLAAEHEGPGEVRAAALVVQVQVYPRQVVHLAIGTILALAAGRQGRRFVRELPLEAASAPCQPCPRAFVGLEMCLCRLLR